MIKKAVKKAVRVYLDKPAETNHRGETVEEFLARGGQVKKLPASMPVEMDYKFVPAYGEKRDLGEG